jgi:UPF0271 protein
VKRIDLNADLGEGAPNDGALLEWVTSANVGCGEHAGSWELTQQTVARCKELGVRIGAHPGYPDRKGLGRVSPSARQRKAWLASVREQTLRFVEAFEPAYLKPHGALYNDAAKGEVWAIEALMALLVESGLPLMGLAESGPDGPVHAAIAQLAGVPFLPEGFVDRGYDARGFLLPRGTPGALLKSPETASAQALALAGKCRSLCVHGDSPGCVEIATAVRVALEGSGWSVVPC